MIAHRNEMCFALRELIHLVVQSDLEKQLVVRLPGEILHEFMLWAARHGGLNSQKIWGVLVPWYDELVQRAEASAPAQDESRTSSAI